MRAHLYRLWESFRRLLSPRRTPSQPSRSVIAAEPLEQRLAPSASPLTAYSPVCSCPFCTGAGNYQIGGSGSDDYRADSKWSQPGGKGATVTITYSFSNLLNGRLGGGLSASTLRQAVREALGRWAAVAPLRFVEVADAGPAPSALDYGASGLPKLRFGHRNIDGANGVLAQAYYPGQSGLAGDIHFDTSERWAVHPSKGYDLLQVATHEIGHTLGLAHQPSTTLAIMNPAYVGRYRGLGTSFLYTDDVNGIRALYGAGTGSVVALGQPSEPGPTPTPAAPAFFVDGTVLRVTGTAGNDLIEWSASRVAVNGVAFTGNLGQIRSITVDAKGGTDQLRVQGTDAAESFSLSPGAATMAGPIWKLQAVGVENVSVQGGTGDSAVLLDSAGNDTLTAQPGTVRFQGSGFDVTLRNVPAVTARGRWGTDRATLDGSSGNDTLAAGRIQSVLSGPGYKVTVKYFDVVVARASGGHDRANLYDSPGNDVARAGPTWATLAGPNSAYSIHTTGFDQVAVRGTNGTDSGYLYDSAGDDIFVGTVSSGSLSGFGWSNLLLQFDRVYVNSAAGGQDLAYLHDSHARDRFVGKGNTGTLFYPAALTQVTGFDAVTVTSKARGQNTRSFSGVDYDLIWGGSW